MGIKDLFQSGAKTIVTAFGNVAVSGVYHSSGTTSYNTTTGVKTEVGGTNQTVSIIFDEYCQ